MKKFLGVILCFCSISATASHIVGGEFELLFVSKNIYNLRLIYYFDAAHAAFPEPPEENEPEITVAIYRKWDNAFMDFVTLSFTPPKERVPFRQAACFNADVVTDRLVYSSEIFLADNLYDHPEGYYVVWERCCRNYTITNIYSLAPNGNPNDTAGQTFYLEFSPVVKNGVTFVNSSPRLFAPLNTYACTQKDFFVKFSGLDDNGDSLVYSMVTPLNTHSIESVPPPEPAPYPEVRWKEPYSATNILGGSPDLRIRHDGYLTVRPMNPGLFVFAVRCEEYRDGVKIGETRRDYQIFVAADCDPAVNPVIRGKPFNSSEFVSENELDVLIPRNLSDDMRCMEILVSDADAHADGSEEISVTAVALNYKGDVAAILPALSSATLTPEKDSAIFQVCFDKCPYFGGITTIAIVAEDNTCGSPLQDTLLIHLDHERNLPAYFDEPSTRVFRDTILGSTSGS